MYPALLALLLLPLLALAQSTTSNPPETTNNNNNNTSSPTATPNANGTNTAAQSGNGTTAAPQSTTSVITSVISNTVFGPGRVLTTQISTRLITTVLPVITATPGNTTASTNSSTSTTPTSTVILPTAPTDINGGGVGGAPSPGASSSNGEFGPNDGFIAAATSLQKKVLTVSLLASLVGGGLLVL